MLFSSDVDVMKLRAQANASMPASYNSNIQLLGPTVFREPRNFEPSRGIWPFPRNFTEFRVNTEIPQQRPNSVSLYCCCNCDTQSLRTAARACWFQWRVFTFSLLTYLSFYLPDLCRWRWPVISTIDWWVMTMTDMIISRWRRGVVVTALVVSTKLLYVEPG